MFSKLPTEIFRFIHCYLGEFEFGDYFLIHEVICKDTERTWRNFLSVNSAHSFARKEAMIFWTLNTMSEKKYSENEQFRQYLNERMACPSQQLRLSKLAPICRITTDSMLELLRKSEVDKVCVNHIHLTKLPSSTGLKFLSIFGCPS
jgi:hypothetical protein